MHPVSDRSVTWFTSGIGAVRTAGLHAALAAHDHAGYSAYARAAPSLLLVEVGVNDAIHADETPIEATAASYRSILEGFRSHGIDHLMLVGAPPVRPTHQPGPWGVADLYDQVYRPIALEFDLPLLDLLSRWRDYETARGAGYLEDQVHPTALGHRDIGDLLASAISAL
jgi:lysophospholipase L1-like esterase